MKNEFAPEVKTAIYEAIARASRGEVGRITQRDLAAQFPGLGIHSHEQRAGYRDIDSTTRQIRAVVAEIDTDPLDSRLICEDTRGYFVPTTLTEVINYADKVERTGKARIEATQLRIDATNVKKEAFRARLNAEAAAHLNNIRAEAGFVPPIVAALVGSAI